MIEERDTLVVQLTDLPSTEWRRLVMQMEWQFRDLSTPPNLPPVFKRCRHLVETPWDWALIREAVSRRRRAAAAKAKKAASEARKYRKRTYMRGYMRNYRNG